MPTGVYVRTEKHKRKMSEVNKGRLPWDTGKKLSEEHKRKLSESHKGRHWKMSKEAKKRLSELHKGKASNKKGTYLSEKQKKNLSEINKGKYHTEETKRKMSEAHKGIKSYLWKGGITPAYLQHLNGFDWKEIRKQVYRRDYYICQLCKKKCHNDIQAHHIIPWRISKDDSLENLITLCRSCHIKKERREIWKK